MVEPYVFKSPVPQAETIDIVGKVIASLGGTFKNNVGVWRSNTHFTFTPAKVQFYFYEKDGQCNVRVIFRRHDLTSPKFWLPFIKALNELYPDIDFGLSPNMPRKLVAVLDVSGDTEDIYIGKTSGGTSLGGMILGEAAFGTPGAIIGGMSGTQRTIGTTRTVYSDQVNVRLLWSDGFLEEKRIIRNSPFYHKIMNMIS